MEKKITWIAYANYSAFKILMTFAFSSDTNNLSRKLAVLTAMLKTLEGPWPSVFRPAFFARQRHEKFNYNPS